jgi:hypothetical protein
LTKYRNSLYCKHFFILIIIIIMTEQFRPHPENPKQKSPEAGAGPLGLPPPPTPEQTAQGGVSKSPERHPRPDVWDVLERRVRLDAPDIEDRPKWGTPEYRREADELKRLSTELEEGKDPRAKLIRKLYGVIRCEPAPFPAPVKLRNLSLEEYQQFRSWLEKMSDDEITEEICKAEEEFDRKSDEFFEKEGGGFPPPNSIVRV